MIYIIRSDMRRALLSRGFLVGVFGMIVVIAFSTLESLFTALAHSPGLPDGYHIQVISDALSSDAMVLAVPILCALPFTSAFVDDMQSGFIKLFLPRTGVNTYIWGKLLACALSGGLVLSIGIMLACMLSTLVFMPMEMTLSGDANISFMLIIAKLPFFFLSGMFWSLFGFTLASVTRSRYMAYASPLIFYYVLVILYQRYFHSFYYIYPAEWLNPTHDWLAGNGGLAMLLLLLTIVTAIVFVVFAKRTFGNG